MNTPPPIRLIAGLGNVGAEYERTRHNAGFWFVDAVAHRAGGSFAPERKFHGDIARIRGGGRDLWLLKPSTYMNRSGQAVVALALFYRILPTEILVAHDELDLPPGALKLKAGGGHAGHNGLKDIQARLSTPDFWRLRLGIGHPRTLQLQQPVADFVLHPPRRDEQQAIDEAIDRALDAVPLLVDGQFERAMMKLHAAPRRPSDAGTERDR
ncbi:MAG TPA: aminoacyl-tRNA hydrolase [Burkholderiaceae bacterium]|nr:aminoacyl-tRNA hydrolase [Burkholderiaceae bacterium]